MTTGAARILELAASAGVSACFANPGNTELGLVQALEGRPSIRPVLGLFEGVCTGAADGFTQVSDVPALTLLHLGPGFANGMANLHNARRAGTGVVNLVGDHPAGHLVHDSPLTSDILGMAATASDWARATTSSTLTTDMCEAPRPHADLYGALRSRSRRHRGDRDRRHWRAGRELCVSGGPGAGDARRGRAVRLQRQ
jgi:thiamine pyrophosphate-dependent acetolactate synthase large subunit-like protein